MLSLYLKSVGIVAPGINNWNEAIQIFKQPENYASLPVAKKLETLLPANERRRAARVTQLALYAAQQAGVPEVINQCLQVFSSAHGDVNTFHQISLALAMPGRPVSPTRFHNSVHNAPAGYWSIATQSQTASTSITADLDSFSAGLLESAVQLNAPDNHQERDCLLVSYDEIPPAAFQSLINTSAEFACALKLSRDHSGGSVIARFDISLSDNCTPERQLANDSLEQLRQSNPQAQVLPLLEAVALQRNDTISLSYFEQCLEIKVTPLAATLHDQ